MASILLLNQYYPPDPVHTARHAHAIASRLVEEGHSLRALVGQPSYLSGLDSAPVAEVLDGVEVARVNVGERKGRERMSTRVSGYGRYLGGAWWRSRGLDPDLVISFHNPPAVPLVAARVARRTGAAFFYIVHDIHPDVLVATDLVHLPQPLVRAWDRANRHILRAADQTVVPGEGMKRTLVDKGAAADAVEMIPLWPEPALEPRPSDRAWRSQHGVADGLMVLCAGNMGAMHPLEGVIEAAQELRERSVTFVIAGDGVRRPHWENEVARRSLDRVRFTGYLADEDFARAVAAADVTVVPLQGGMERLAVPSRAFTFLSAGRPVIASMAREADVATLVERTGAGWQVATGGELAALLEGLLGDPKALVRAGRRARTSYERDFTRAAITDRYAELVNATLERRRAAAF